MPSIDLTPFDGPPRPDSSRAQVQRYLKYLIEDLVPSVTSAEEAEELAAEFPVDAKILYRLPVGAWTCTFGEIGGRMLYHRIQSDKWKPPSGPVGSF